MPKLMTDWILLVLVVGSALALIVVHLYNYIAEVHLAYALPLSIVTGLSAIALAIYKKA